MNKVCLRVLKFFAELLLFFTPGGKIPDQADQLPKPGWTTNSWKLMEIRSDRTGFRHRCYLHPSDREDAPVLLLLHGLFLDARNFLNVGELSGNWTLLAYDFPEASTAYTGVMGDFDILIDDFLSCLKIDSLYLCGVSFGGGIGLSFTVNHPDRILGLVLVSTAIAAGNSGNRNAATGFIKSVFLRDENKLLRLFHFIRRVSLGGKNSPMRIISDIWRVKHSDWYRQAFLSLASLTDNASFDHVNCPVLVIHGNRDHVVPISNVRRIKKVLPQAEIRILKGGNHILSYRRGPEVVQLILDFFPVVKSPPATFRL